MDERKRLLHIRNLRVSFPTPDGMLQVVRGFDIDVDRGGITGIVGESGSGKTVSVRSIMGLFGPGLSRISADRMVFDGMDLMAAGETELRNIRGRRISYVFQDPGRSLNPNLTVGRQIETTLKCHGFDNPRDRAIQAMTAAGLGRPGELYLRLPSQLSGGQCQRVMIAQAVALEPDLIIADEPTSSVDAGLQQTILDLFVRLNGETGTAVILISHDFDVIRSICRDVVVMYGGLVMESGTIGEVLGSPKHPYSRELIRCTESLAGMESPLYSLPGRPPTPKEFGASCPFRERCTESLRECGMSIPEYVGGFESFVRCLNPLDGGGNR